MMVSYQVWSVLKNYGKWFQNTKASAVNYFTTAITALAYFKSTRLKLQKIFENW